MKTMKYFNEFYERYEQAIEGEDEEVYDEIFVEELDKYCKSLFTKKVGLETFENFLYQLDGEDELEAGYEGLYCLKSGKDMNYNMFFDDMAELMRIIIREDIYRKYGC